MNKPTESDWVLSEDELFKRYRRSLKSPSGKAVCAALAGSPERMTAREIATKAYVSQVCARDHAYRLAKLGYATESKVRVPGCRETSAWQVTPAGLDFMGPDGILGPRS